MSHEGDCTERKKNFERYQKTEKTQNASYRRRGAGWKTPAGGRDWSEGSRGGWKGVSKIFLTRIILKENSNGLKIVHTQTFLRVRAREGQNGQKFSTHEFQYYDENVFEFKILRFRIWHKQKILIYSKKELKLKNFLTITTILRFISDFCFFNVAKINFQIPQISYGLTTS